MSSGTVAFMPSFKPMQSVYKDYPNVILGIFDQSDQDLIATAHYVEFMSVDEICVTWDLLPNVVNAVLKRYTAERLTSC